VIDANIVHGRIWEEIERRRGKPLPDGWKCGNYDVDKYIRHQQARRLPGVAGTRRSRAGSRGKSRGGSGVSHDRREPGRS
jgi:hypothetical protein